MIVVEREMRVMENANKLERKKKKQRKNQYFAVWVREYFSVMISELNAQFIKAGKIFSNSSEMSKRNEQTYNPQSSFKRHTQRHIAIIKQHDFN
ncbi:CLUMA_CG019178, isoform A [Clunio marinus]|uniref:CLUMA_CG019178, isoform A n=1 Tax=Clunio marinus TaxID=568069 RepID=A0A1J1J1R3_9DIPT|nr:CLUMA_CG019178, isoform A [Clunio marinus]